MKALIEQKIVYANHFPALKKQSTDNNGWHIGCCPFHQDKSPSFTYNPNTGAWKCFGACGSGDVYSFIERFDNLTFYEVIEKLVKEYNIEPDRPRIKESTVTSYVSALKKNSEVMEYLIEKRGLTEKTIEKYQLGWSKELQRVSIPVRDKDGKLKNIRLYGIKRKKGKMISYFIGEGDGSKKVKHSYGSPIQLYGVDDLVKSEAEYIVVCEGEFDRLVLQQNGFMAVTGTGGCDSFLLEWREYFKGKEAVVCFDVDAPGRSAAIRITRLLKRFGVKVKDVMLPLSGKAGDNDITDYFKKHNADDFTKLVVATEYDKTPADDEQQISDEPIMLESFVDIEREEYVNKRVACGITISGETSESYHAVEQFKVAYCAQVDKGKCSECLDPITIDVNSHEYIGSCMSTNMQVIGMLRQKCCVYGQKPAIDITSQSTIKELFCHQQISHSIYVEDKLGNVLQAATNQEELFEKRVYYLSPEAVKPGDYLATGYVKTHPKTQAITFLIEHLEPQEEDYQSFRLKDSAYLLKEMQELSMNELLEDLTNNVTRIYEREEILLAVLITFFSPLWITFNSAVIRGWIIAVIIGDSGLGKTQTYSKLSQFLGIGDFFSALTGSRTGLSYALVDNPKKGGWSCKIGKYPKNSRKLLAIDETQCLPEGDLGSITKAMDEGFIQIERVKSQGYECMTRLLMLSNPKDHVTMDTYAYGCETLQDIFASTIIRRIDFAVFVNAGDIKDGALINRVHKNSKQIVTSEMLRAAVYWVWNLQANQIIFDDEATAHCLKQASVMTAKYGYAVEVPLVSKADFKNNLARISAAIAGINLSANAVFTKLLVRKEHVDKAVHFLNTVYTHNNCGLEEYSFIEQQRTEVTNYDRIEKFFMDQKEQGKYASSGESFFVDIIGILRSSRAFRAGDLGEQVGCSFEAAKKHLRGLTRYNLIQRGATHQGYVKTVKFNKFLRRFLLAHPDYLKAGVAYD
jgi:5S rRNA maturation endonuclease (ribonuclease M5)